MIDRLEHRGVLVRCRSVGDRRRQDLYLTDEGETVLARVKRAIA